MDSYLVLLLLIAHSFALYIPNIHSRDDDSYMVDSSKIPGFNPQWNNILSMNAGHIPITEDTHSTLYFWSFHHTNTSLDRPLIIWLNGGPGCSSMDGALMEIGPLRVNENLNSPKIEWNKGWFERADLLFIDQPSGTGFSFNDEDHDGNNDSFDLNLNQSTQHLINFMNNYFEKFPNQLNQYQSIIIAGESYAGQYIPHFANSILSTSFSSKLKAVLLGNAWLDPNLQSLSYIPFSIDNNIINLSDSSEQRKISILLDYQDKCQNLQNSNEKKILFDNHLCDSILTSLLLLYKAKNDNKCINVYDIRKTDTYPSCGNNWPEILSQTTNFLNLENVQNSLHVSNPWNECNNNVHTNFKPDSTDKLGAKLLNTLLDNGIKVNLFSGTNDLICNYLGTEMVIKEHLSSYLSNNDFQIPVSISNKNLAKRDITKFQMDSIWMHDDIQTGSFWKRGNLTYIKIDNASHMVPYDYSIQSIGIIDLALRDDDDDDDDNENDTGLINTYTNSLHESSAPPSFEDSTTAGMSTIMKLIILSLVILLIVILFQYLYGYFRTSSKYNKIPKFSALSNSGSSAGSSSSNGSGKKKKVHWIDQNDDVEETIHDHIHKSYELEDLNLNQYHNDDATDNDNQERLREGSFEDEEPQFSK